LSDDNIVEDNETFRLKLVSTSNSSVDISDNATVTISNDDNATITLDNVTVSEGAGVATMTLTLSNPVSSAVTVDISTLDIGYPADNGTDFLEVLGKTLVIPALATALQDNITIYQDSVAENNETFGVSLNNPSHGSVTVGGSVVVTITDDEARPSVTLSPSSTSVVESVGTVTLTVSQSVKAATDTIVTLSLAGTADNGTDYTLSSDAITISAGSLSENATLTITDDSSPESAETILVDVLSVAGGNGATDGATQQTITITDNDAPTVNLSASLTTITEGDTGTRSVTITATLSSTAATDTTVTLTPTGTANGSGTDYTLNSSTINVLSGNLTGTTTIDVVGDYIDEDNETIVLDINTVSGGGGASENGTQTVIITILDDDNSSLIINPTSITVNEASTTTDTFTVKLSSQPNGNVVLNLNANDNTEAKITSSTSISFDNTNWNNNQTVTVQAVDDSEVDDNVSSTITLSIDTSSTTDNIYDLLDNQTVTVITVNDDTTPYSDNLTLTGEEDIVRNHLSWSWSPSDPTPDHYYIYWSNSGEVDTSSNRTPKILNSKNSYTHGGLDNITYYYRIAVEKSGITTFFPPPSDSPLALTPKPLECSSDYTAVLDNDTDLIAYYPFETDMKDYSTQSSPGTGHPYDLVKKGNAIFGGGCAYGNAVYFDGDIGDANTRNDGSWGSNDNFTDSNVSIPDNWTLSFWVNPDKDMDKNTAAFASGGTSASGGYNTYFQIDYDNNGAIGIDGANYDSNAATGRLNGPVLEKGLWYHFAVVQYLSGVTHSDCSASSNQCTNVKFYVNGKEYDSASKWHAKWGGDGIKIGLNRGGKNNWKGYIDEVKIYKKAFTVDNITNIYSKSLPPIAESFDVQDNVNNIHLDLSWFPVKSATSYNLYRDNVSGITIEDFYKNISINGGTAPTAICNSTSCTFTDDNVTVGSTYYYRVTGVNNIGFGNLAPAIEKSECVGGC